MPETTTTKTARHTPGPWRVLDDTNPPVVGIILPDGRPLDLCDVIAQPDDDETAANARLIAAAPALAEALAGMMEDWCNLSRAEMRARMDRGHAALALLNP